MRTVMATALLAALLGGCSVGRYDLTDGRSGPDDAPAYVVWHRGKMPSGCDNVSVGMIDDHVVSYSGWGGSFRARINPGRHRIVAHYYRFKLDEPTRTIPAAFTFLAESGRSYCVGAAETTETAWRPVIHDVTDR